MHSRFPSVNLFLPSEGSLVNSPSYFSAETRDFVNILEYLKFSFVFNLLMLLIVLLGLYSVENVPIRFLKLAHSTRSRFKVNISIRANCYVLPKVKIEISIKIQSRFLSLAVRGPIAPL